jgi:hypothetical protein
LDGSNRRRRRVGSSKKDFFMFAQLPAHCFLTGQTSEGGNETPLEETGLPDFSW